MIMKTASNQTNKAKKKWLIALLVLTVLIGGIAILCVLSKKGPIFELGLVRSEILGHYRAKGMPIHAYCFDTDAQLDLCEGVDEITLITANDPVALMRRLGREIGTTKEY